MSQDLVSPWAELPVAVVVALVTLSLTIAWNIVARRRALLDEHLDRTTRAFTVVWTRLLKPAPFLASWTRPSQTLDDTVTAMAAMYELRVHLKQPKWRSTAWGFVETLETLTRQFVDAGVALETPGNGDQDARKKELIAAAKTVVVAVGRWKAKRRSYWKGDISSRLRDTLSATSTSEERPRQIPWWRWLRPGR